MKRRPRAFIAARVVLAGAVLGVLVCAPPTGGKTPGAGEAAEAIDRVFDPIEEAMGIDVKASGIKVNILGASLDVGSLTLTHPDQGKFARISGVRALLGVVLGVTDPKKSAIVVEDLDLDLDFAGDRFWRVASSGGKPIPGAPNLYIGKLDVRDADVTLVNGKGGSMKAEGVEGEIRKLKLPGKVWSKGDVPNGRWVEASLEGGTLAIAGLPQKLDLEELDFYFKSSVLHVTQLKGDLEGGGTVTIAGRVHMTTGKPTSYDMVVDIDDLPIDRPHLTAMASGRLLVQGPAGDLKIGGKLDLTDVGTLRSAKWSRTGCNSKVKLAVTLAPETGSQFKPAEMTGSLCKGRITTD